MVFAYEAHRRPEYCLTPPILFFARISKGNKHINNDRKLRNQTSTLFWQCLCQKTKRDLFAKPTGALGLEARAKWGCGRRKGDDFSCCVQPKS